MEKNYQAYFLKKKEISNKKKKKYMKDMFFFIRFVLKIHVTKNVAFNNGI